MESGLLGSLVYVGLVLSCPITGYALVKIKSQRKVLLIGLFANTCNDLFLTVTSSTGLLFARFLAGLSRDPFVYPPVWVDEFALSVHDNMIGILRHGGCRCHGWVSGNSNFHGSRRNVEDRYVDTGVRDGYLFFRFLLLRGRLFNARGGEEARMLNTSQKIIMKRSKSMGNQSDGKGRGGG